jgi:hypothetical protein
MRVCVLTVAPAGEQVTLVSGKQAWTLGVDAWLVLAVAAALVAVVVLVAVDTWSARTAARRSGAVRPGPAGVAGSAPAGATRLLHEREDGRDASVRPVAVDAQRAVDRQQVALDGTFRDTELLRRRPVRQTLGDQPQDLELRRAQLGHRGP